MCVRVTVSRLPCRLLPNTIVTTRPRARACPLTQRFSFDQVGWPNRNVLLVVASLRFVMSRCVGLRSAGRAARDYSDPTRMRRASTHGVVWHTPRKYGDRAASCAGRRRRALASRFSAVLWRVRARLAHTRAAGEGEDVHDDITRDAWCAPGVESTTQRGHCVHIPDLA